MEIRLRYSVGGMYLTYLPLLPLCQPNTYEQRAFRLPSRRAEPAMNTQLSAVQARPIFTHRMQMLAVNPGQMQNIFNTSVRQDLERVVQQ